MAFLPPIRPKEEKREIKGKKKRKEKKRNREDKKKKGLTLTHTNINSEPLGSNVGGTKIPTLKGLVPKDKTSHISEDVVGGWEMGENSNRRPPARGVRDSK
ncbi:predicted protein [Histoplasma capsulatum var. duboisii H88]|uniref:Predicted protein n=1 Tax=Ajellomyces capsulatus (strain H88) TaxID=544711 RepID=F0UNP5_AJEC8|nr:predicted protein [Histoplasma capsulatum var. duboisii H88]